jgi:hypothetical protein
MCNVVPLVGNYHELNNCKNAIARHLPSSDHPNRHKFLSCTAIEEQVFYVVQGQLVQPVGQSLS